MKTTQLRHTISWAVIACFFAATMGGANAQMSRRGAGQNSSRSDSQPSPLVVAHQTLLQAAQLMESALPIYDGHRHRAIQLARIAASQIVDAANGTPATSAITGKTNAQRAALVPKGTESELTHFNSEQIAASNIKIQQSLVLLQKAMAQCQSIGNDNAGHMAEAYNFAGYAIQAANKGLSFVASKNHTN